MQGVRWRCDALPRSHSRLRGTSLEARKITATTASRRLINSPTTTSCATGRRPATLGPQPRGLRPDSLSHPKFRMSFRRPSVNRPSNDSRSSDEAFFIHNGAGLARIHKQTLPSGSTWRKTIGETDARSFVLYVMWLHSVATRARLQPIFNVIGGMIQSVYGYCLSQDHIRNICDPGKATVHCREFVAARDRVADVLQQGDDDTPTLAENDSLTRAGGGDDSSLAWSTEPPREKVRGAAPCLCCEGAALLCRADIGSHRYALAVACRAGVPISARIAMCSLWRVVLASRASVVHARISHGACSLRALCAATSMRCSTSPCRITLEMLQFRSTQHREFALPCVVRGLFDCACRFAAKNAARRDGQCELERAQQLLCTRLGDKRFKKLLAATEELHLVSCERVARCCRERLRASLRAPMRGGGVALNIPGFGLLR